MRDFPLTEQDRGFRAEVRGACHRMRDHEEAVRAFFDKRPPKFTGE